MNSVQQNPVEGAHQALRNVLLNGRVLINGLSLTGNELGMIVQGEQMLYEKAMQLDKAQELTKKVKEPKKSNIIPLKQPEKKE